MQREITIKEIEATLNEDDNIDEPIVVKRANKKNVFIVDENYLDKLKDLEVIKGLLEAEEDKKDGKVENARKVLEGLRAIYG
ncbi:MAG: hypothetical protein FWF46_09230 [Oscillospiraceae bacterium]|nr:hypothetical protein [Oscillospiraceae bacterium]